jgi:hypothetical protein
MGPFLGWLVGLVVPVQDIFVLPWLLSARYKILFSSSYTISIPLSSYAGQAAVLGRLSFSKCLWSCAKLGQMNYNT